MSLTNGAGRPDPATLLALVYRLATLGAFVYLAHGQQAIQRDLAATPARVAEVAGVRGP